MMEREIWQSASLDDHQRLAVFHRLAVFDQHSRITYDPAADTFAKCDLCYWREGGPACVESCPINIRIRQGIVKVDAGRMCLSEPVADKATWDKLRAFQTFEGSPASGKA